MSFYQNQHSSTSDIGNNNKTFIWRLLQKTSERQIQDHVKKNNNVYNRKKQ